MNPFGEACARNRARKKIFDRAGEPLRREASWAVVTQG